MCVCTRGFKVVIGGVSFSDDETQEVKSCDSVEGSVCIEDDIGWESEKGASIKGDASSDIAAICVRQHLMGQQR